MLKTLEDVKCAPEIALAWAVSAKNALHNNGGFSPNQLVFGRNTNNPSVLVDRPPALESVTSSDIIRTNMNAMHSARKNYIAAENSEKIRRALRHKVRTYSDVVFNNGDKVYYRRKNFKGWKGPGVVLGQEGQFVLIRHGGAFYRVHPCHLMKLKQDVSKATKTSDQVVHPNSADGSSLERSSDIKYFDDGDEDDMKNASPEVRDDGANVNEVPEVEQSRREANTSSIEHFKDGSVKPKRNSYVKYKLCDDKSRNRAKVFSTRPKQTGQYKDWINVHVDSQEEPVCVNWDKVDEWCDLPYPEQALLLTGDQE